MSLKRELGEIMVVTTMGIVHLEENTQTKANRGIGILIAAQVAGRKHQPLRGRINELENDVHEIMEITIRTETTTDLTTTARSIITTTETTITAAAGGMENVDGATAVKVM